MQVLVTQTLDTLTRDVLLSVESQDTDFARREDVLVSVSTKLMSLMNRCRRIDIEQRQLGSLTYESMKERKEDSIKDAHPFTLNWLFESPSIGFTEWLRSGTGIYWIRGKACCYTIVLCRFDTADSVIGWQRQVDPDEIRLRSWGDALHTSRVGWHEAPSYRQLFLLELWLPNAKVSTGTFAEPSLPGSVSLPGIHYSDLLETQPCRAVEYQRALSCSTGSRERDGIVSEILLLYRWAG